MPLDLSRPHMPRVFRTPDCANDAYHCARNRPSVLVLIEEKSRDTVCPELSAADDAEMALLCASPIDWQARGAHRGPLDY
jgi:hypothetical protein